MDTQIINIFQDQATELNNIQSSNPSIDLTDWRLTQAQVSSLTTNPNFFVTTPITEHGYYEIEFLQANNYWGINFNFGNDPNGVLIRQGIAHLIDRANFAQNEVDIAGAAPIDSPIPSGSSYSGSTFIAPNSCQWDTFKGTAAACTQTGGTPGGFAYNCVLSVAPCPTGTLGATAPNTWQAQIGSADFCAAATHIRDALNAGVFISHHGATFNANCVLLAPGSTTPGVGWPANVTSNTVNFYPRLDDPPRRGLGDSVTEEICALWTGSYTTGCNPFLTVSVGSITTFCGFITSTTGISNCWWMYPGAFTAFPLDASVYFGYNSQLVSGGTWDHPACASNTPRSSANNYEYICNSAYDAASNQVEFASSVPAAFSAATNAMDIFGRNVFTIPVFTTRDQNAYLHNWSRVINGDSAGIPNQFTWLNARTNTPATGLTGCPNVTPFSDGLCVRQGFKQPTRSLSWYIASTLWDQFVLGDVYDSLGVENPSNTGQLIDWMTIRTQELSNAALGYTPPTGTTDNFRFTLRPDLFWHDGSKVTAWDVQFSFASLLASGAFSGAGLAPLVPPSGSCNPIPGNCADQITVLTPTQFDVHVYQHGPFTQLGLATTPILPGRYWSVAGSTAWVNCVTAGSCPVSAMSADPNKLGFTYDPINNGLFIGSGAWECVSTGVGSPAGTLGKGCSSTGLQNPPPTGSYALTRNGFGFAPGSSPTNQYFRSSGTLALYLWSGNTGDPVGDPLNFSRLAACVGRPTVPLGQTSGCGHWQQGIGASGGPTVIGAIQAGILLRFIFINWISPFTASSPPDGLASFNPVLYEGSATLNPASGVGCLQSYPTGGYDC
jgi:ABC-type transport system substrate-binding protein